MQKRYKCGICGTLTIQGIFEESPERPLPAELLPPGAEPGWSYVRVHVCDLCRSKCDQWFHANKAVALDMRTAKAVSSRTKPQPWHVPAELIPPLYAALLVATEAQRNAYLRLWLPPQPKRKRA